MPDIQGNAEFTRIGMEKESAPVRMDDVIFEGRAQPSDIGVFDGFYFDDLGAKIRQILGRQRARAHPTEIAYPYAL
jgi:hypothetical protein